MVCSTEIELEAQTSVEWAATPLANSKSGQKECSPLSQKGPATLESTAPDGGLKAWLVVLGSFCAIIVTYGVSNGTGTIQEYLSRNQLKDYSDSDIGWIFSIWLFCMSFGGIQSGPVFDAYGPVPLIIPGAIGWVASLFILSVCKQYYQFVLGFSVLGGLSASLILNPAYTVLGHWFRKHLSLATGLAAVGGAVGGIFIPLMLQRLFPRIGYGWSIRVLAFITLGLCLVCAATMRSRTLNRKVNWREAVPDVRSLRDLDFALCCVGLFFVEWGMFVPVVYLVTYARAQGLTDAYSNAIMAYLNVGSAAGRVAPGYLADRFGNYNVAVVTSGVSGILCIALWIPAGTTKAGVTTFAVLFGFWSGSSLSLLPVCVSSISTVANYGKRYGMAYSIASIASLTGLPIAGALTQHNYLGMKLFAGVSFIGASSMLMLTRWVAVKGRRKF